MNSFPKWDTGSLYPLFEKRPVVGCAQGRPTKAAHRQASSPRVPQALTVLVNAPPTSGFLTVEPTTGVVLQTAFSFACSGWVDDATDLPLLYSFFFEIYGADGTEYQLVAKTPTTSYSGALLPQGGGNASWIVGIGYIYDQLSASARASATIVCAPAVIVGTAFAGAAW